MAWILRTIPAEAKAGCLDCSPHGEKVRREASIAPCYRPFEVPTMHLLHWWCPWMWKIVDGWLLVGLEGRWWWRAGWRQIYFNLVNDRPLNSFQYIYSHQTTITSCLNSPCRVLPSRLHESSTSVLVLDKAFDCAKNPPPSISGTCRMSTIPSFTLKKPIISQPYMMNTSGRIVVCWL